jgi:aminoglycoside phosphotransferase (APT) family kinase protein
MTLRKDARLSDIPDPGPVPERILVEAELVRRLLEEQFPQWAGLPVEPVAPGGWDNWTFHLGSDKVVRLPSAAEYAHAVEKEHRWLPVLAPRLPLPIPVPLAKGAPSADLSQGFKTGSAAAPCARTTTTPVVRCTN